MTIKDVPMVTSDEIEIELNSILYTADWSSGYNFNKEGKPNIEALRVISVDNTRRFFRARCKKGCERSFSYEKDRCPSEKIFGDLTTAVNHVIDKINDDLDALSKKSDSIKLTIAHVENQKRVAVNIVPLEPKKVKAE